MEKHLAKTSSVLQPGLADEQRPPDKHGEAELLEAVTVRTEVLGRDKAEELQ